MAHDASTHALITEGAPADAVISPDGSKLYVSAADGNVRVYDIASGALLATWDVGNRLGGIDISADGSFLMVVERDIVAYQDSTSTNDPQTTITAYRVDTSTGQVTSFPYTYESHNSSAFYDVAIFADGRVAFSSENTHRPLRILDPSTGEYGGPGETFASAPVLVASRDRGEVLMAPVNVSDMPLYLVRSDGAIFARSTGSGYSGGVVAYSEEADLVVQHTYAVQPTTGRVFTSLYVYDGALQNRFDLLETHSQWLDGRIAGLAFDAAGENLYVLDEETNEVVQLKTSDWSIVRSYPVGRDVTDHADGDYGNRLLLSPDGRTLIVATGSGIQLLSAVNEIVGTEGPDVLVGSDGIDVIQGLGGDDTIAGAGSADEIDGGAGADLLDGGAGADSMAGGPGDDIIHVDDAGDEAIEAPREGLDEIRTGLAVYSLKTTLNFENLTGTSSSGQSLSGDGADNVITGGSGDDVLAGNGGDDVLIGLAGADLLRGGTGNDVYAIDAADTVEEQFAEGTDEVRTMGTIYVLGANVENLRGLNDAGHDLRGNSAPNGIIGADGNDVIRAQDGGDDALYGKEGNDHFYFGAAFTADDFVDGGLGYDVVYLQGDYAIDFNDPNYAGSILNVESLGLLGSADAGFGGAAGDGELDYAIVWNDAMLAPGATLTVNASRLAAGENLVFDGSGESDGNIRLFGGAGIDTLTTGGGSDQLYGGSGADALTGGAGADLYRYYAVGDSTGGAFDTILGFASGEDRIDLQRIDARATTPENDAFAFIGSAAFSAAGQLRAFNVSGDLWQVEGDVDGDGAADLVIQVHVEAGQPLDAGDFLL